MVVTEARHQQPVTRRCVHGRQLVAQRHQRHAIRPRLAGLVVAGHHLTQFPLQTGYGHPGEVVIEMAVEFGHVVCIVRLLELRHHGIAADHFGCCRSRTGTRCIGCRQREGISGTAAGRTVDGHRQRSPFGTDAGRRGSHAVAGHGRAAPAYPFGLHLHGTGFGTQPGADLFGGRGRRHGRGRRNGELSLRLARSSPLHFGHHGTGAGRQRRHQPAAGIHAADGGCLAAVAHLLPAGCADRQHGGVTHHQITDVVEPEIGRHGQLLLLRDRRPGGVTRLAGRERARARCQRTDPAGFGLHRAHARRQAAVAYLQAGAGRGGDGARFVRRQRGQGRKGQRLRAGADDGAFFPIGAFGTAAGSQCHQQGCCTGTACNANSGR